MLAIVLAVLNVMGAGGGNALTLPAARHLVRLDPQNGKPATWLLAAQQDGADGHWLSFWRSDDEAQSWTWYAPIQDTPIDRDTPDLIAVGMDVAMVYSYEGPDITGSTAHDVYFQWWRWDGNSNWIPQSAVRVFDSSSSSTAYLRGEIARDSVGRIWIWAQRLNSDGTFTMVMTVSSDGGATFQTQPSMDSFANRPGGRIMPVGGNQLMLLYSTHGIDPGYMRLRNDSDAVGTWSSPQVVFSEGIYHGAALSAVDDGAGGIHLFYKDINEQLYYRHYSGSWGSRTQVEGVSDWALQPATTRVGSDVVVFWNRMYSSGFTYDFRYAILSNGVLSSSTVLDSSGGFKGYPAAVDVLPNTVPSVPCFYGNTVDAANGGSIAIAYAPTPNSAPPPPPPDGGTGGGTDGGVDAGTTTTSGGTLFSDDFNRAVSGSLGGSWKAVQGVWRDDGIEANSDRDNQTNQAAVGGLSCSDCTVQGLVVNFGVAPVTLDLREQASNDRYDVTLTSGGHLQIRRHNGSTTTVLGDVASGIGDLSTWNTIALAATGAGPVQLVASVNGAPKVSVTDASSSAIVGPGTVGITTSMSGIGVDNFIVTGSATSSGGGADAGTADAGTPDSGTPDAGTPDAGTPDAGTPDAGTPDAGTPDAGTPDAGTPDAGAPDAGTTDGGTTTTTGTIFFDDFNRSLTDGLGANWTVPAGRWLDDNRANSDLNGLDRATVNGVSCADCRADVKMANFAGGESMIEMRVSGGNRYVLALMANGNLQIRRYAGSTVTVLGTVASGIADLGSYSTVSLSVQGAFPVTLTGLVNGAPKVSATDSSAAAYTGSGGVGIAATWAGIIFDDFTVTGPVVSGGTGSGSDAGTPDAGAVDAGTPDAGTVDAGTPDAGTVDAGTPDAGSTDAGTATSGGPNLTVQTTYTSTGFDLLAVDPAGTSYGINLNDSDSAVYASADARNWTKRGDAPGSLWNMSAFSDGTLIADVSSGGTHFLARSTDHGATWSTVLAIGNYRTLSPHSFGELDGAVYYIEYQDITTSSTPIHLWKSTDHGATWFQQFTFQNHRHAHGVMPDPARHALFAFFGDFDSQSGLYRSTDGGASWKSIKSGTQAGDIVDGVVLSDGSFLCGQDVSYQGSTPNFPQIARIALDGTETDYVTLPSASYSTHAVNSVGGFVVTTTHEEGADVEASGWTNGTLWGSGDGVHWQQILVVAQATPGDDVFTDVYWELPTGELVFNVRNAAGFGPGGRGFLLLQPTRQ